MTNSNHIGEDFDNYLDHASYFLKEDALHSLTYDLYFSPTYKYTCRANCQVCYIKDKLKEGFSTFENKVPTIITDKDEERWFSVFAHFNVLRTNDDLTYLRLNYPVMFTWYQKHAGLFEFGMTDNAIFTQKNTLLNHIDLKGLADVSISDYFLRKSNKEGKVLAVLKEIGEKYGIVKFKVIRTNTEPFDYSVQSVVDWLNDNGLPNCIQHDLRYNANDRFDLSNEFDYQTNYILSENNKTYQIYREAVHLYNDRFFYSIDDATDLSWDTFHQITGKFDIKDFLFDVLNGKIKLYNKFADELETVDKSLAQKFRNYYIECQRFNVNKDYNFIPNFMLEDNNKIYQKLVEYGFRRTEVGLYYPGSSAIPIVNYK